MILRLSKEEQEGIKRGDVTVLRLSLETALSKQQETLLYQIGDLRYNQGVAQTLTEILKWLP
jgi:hypothetical protein